MARAKKPSKKSASKRPAKRATKTKPAKRHKSTSKLTPENRKKLHAAQLRREAKAAKVAAAEREAARKKKKRERKAKATARQHATRARKGGQVSLLVQLEGAYGTMRDLAADIVAMSLAVEHSPVMERGQQPWLLLGTFAPEESCGWREIGLVFEAWRDDLILETTIHPQRYTFLRVVYQAFEVSQKKRTRGQLVAVGRPDGFAPASAGPWESVISEAAAATIGYEGEDGEPDADALATKYANAQILAIEVLWSASLA